MLNCDPIPKFKVFNILVYKSDVLNIKAGPFCHIHFLSQDFSCSESLYKCHVISLIKCSQLLVLIRYMHIAWHLSLIFYLFLQKHFTSAGKCFYMPTGRHFSGFFVGFSRMMLGELINVPVDALITLYELTLISVFL